MNKQGNKQNPGGGIEWTHFFGPGTGFTANPVRGCQHGCKWTMPDGSVAICYAKPVGDRFYPGGFENITWHPEELEKIKSHTKPAGIFIDSMSDLFGQAVKTEWIEAVMQTMRECPQHIFFLLTKNPRRLTEFHDWPDNALVGVSAPPTEMYGKPLNLEQQRTWYAKALTWLGTCCARRKWTSIEPLSFDVSEVIRAHRHMFGADGICWAVIGAASNGSKTFQPNPDHLKDALYVLDGLPVFFKGNLDESLTASVGSAYRQEFPKLIL